MDFVCSQTGTRVPGSVRAWLSPAGAPLLPDWPKFRIKDIDDSARSVWRYRSMLPVDAEIEPVTLGEGGTPLVASSLLGIRILVKVDYLQPTGSYKDRGSAVLATALRAEKIRQAVEDSSGNAGASLAAYLARTGVSLQLFVPGSTPAIRVAQAVACGAEVDTSAESRAAAAEMAQSAISGNTAYASHVYSPHFLAGQATMAYEIWEDMGRRLPDNVVMPLGHGVLLLALYHGFRQLVRAGRAERIPRLFGVQARACSPMYQAFVRGSEVAAAVSPRPTMAIGIGVAEPPRSREVLAAVRETGGAIVSLSESEIRRGQALAANLGWYVEPSAASAIAAVVKLDKVVDAADVTLVPLTGSGLKQ